MIPFHPRGWKDKKLWQIDLQNNNSNNHLNENVAACQYFECLHLIISWLISTQKELKELLTAYHVKVTMPNN